MLVHVLLCGAVRNRAGVYAELLGKEDVRTTVQSSLQYVGSIEDHSEREQAGRGRRTNLFSHHKTAAVGDPAEEI